ncbi:MAG: hypothetical protein AAGU32_03145, partial [Bacillota bacterium]
QLVLRVLPVWFALPDRKAMLVLLVHKENLVPLVHKARLDRKVISDRKESPDQLVRRVLPVWLALPGRKENPALLARKEDPALPAHKENPALPVYKAPLENLALLGHKENLALPGRKENLVLRVLKVPPVRKAQPDQLDRRLLPNLLPTPI